MKGKDYVGVGLNLPGKRNIEGLLPEHVVQRVQSANISLITSAINGTQEEQKAAKRDLKRLLLAEFKLLASPGADFEEFYSVVETINQALNDGC